MVCRSFKGGTGAASRRVSCAEEIYTVGILVQANHGSREGLTIAGAPAGREITDLQPSWNKTPSKETGEGGSGF